jgi:hypothetical protein
MLGNAKQTKMEVEGFERLDEVQTTWQNGSETLASLKTGLGGTVAQMERAQHAVDYVENEQ